MKTCFVSMPFGKKIDSNTGISINFDSIYRELVEPAILETQYKPFRIDDVSDFVDMQKNIIESIINSDIMIADLTTRNPNVMYELGIRHMAKPGLTIMICATGTIIPSNISNFKVISYELNDDGTVNNKSKYSFHQLLRYSIEANLDQIVTDSPVYTFLPDLLPPRESTSLENASEVSEKNYKKKKISLVGSSNKTLSREELKEIQSNVLKDPSAVDPNEFVNILKKYRDISAWSDLVDFAERIPDVFKKNPDVQQLYALALNRIGEQEKAIDIIKSLILQTGGDAESYGILGRIYKDKYASSKMSDVINANKFLNEAIINYKLGFEKQPDDFYTGINVINLLLQKGDKASTKELEILLPRVRGSLRNKMDDSVPDYWTFASALELSCIAKDWDEAQKLANLALSLSPDSWMIQTTLLNLKFIQSAFNHNETIKLDQIIAIMQQESHLPMEGLSNA